MQRFFLFPYQGAKDLRSYSEGKVSEKVRMADGADSKVLKKEPLVSFILFLFVHFRLEGYVNSSNMSCLVESMPVFSYRYYR